MEANMSLFLPKLAPLTYGFGFIEAPPSFVEDCVLPWQHSLARKITIERINMPLRDALRRLEPLSSCAFKDLWVETESPWLARFSNGFFSGGESISYLARRCKTRSVSISCTPHTMPSRVTKESRGTWGSTQFALYGPEPKPILNGVRSIAAANDGGSWVFHTSGEIQPFEQVEKYRAPRISDRFTPEMLESYCRAMGIDPFNESFYKPSAVLLVQDIDSWKQPPRLMSLAQRRRELGLES
jgi:hypothetical protein